MTNGNDRIDRIDDDIATVKTILVAVARRAEATSERLDQLIESQGRTQKQLDQLSVKVDALTEDVHIAFQTINLMAENGDRDRAELRERADQDRAEFRDRSEQNSAEILRIWEYLMGQRNGNGDQPQP